MTEHRRVGIPSAPAAHKSVGCSAPIAGVAAWSHTPWRLVTYTQMAKTEGITCTVIRFLSFHWSFRSHDIIHCFVVSSVQSTTSMIVQIMMGKLFVA